MPQWDAEIEVDQALARALIENRYPQLEAESLKLLGSGWDNTVWVTKDGIAFRFPRREIALDGIRQEIALLPEIAPRLPCRVPDASYPGAPSELFPWPWFGSHVIKGREIAGSQLDENARGELAADLGTFLRCLHGLSVPQIDGLPADPTGRADMTIRVPRTRTALDELDASGALTSRAADVLTTADTLPAADGFVLAHGDLHIRHVLVDEAGRLSGVIDWGDACYAPAAVDLSLYWSLFGPAARGGFRATYGNVSDATLLRARVLALFLNATLAVYARDQGMGALESEALDGVERTLTG
ncbi:MAG TPA: phosphotransferase [Solirubrobacteraceae bacterium]|jgi:aminoglycoside phosphotransferase (APT) family kinase protein